MGEVLQKEKEKRRGKRRGHAKGKKPSSHQTDTRSSENRIYIRKEK